MIKCLKISLTCISTSIIDYYNPAVSITTMLLTSFTFLQHIASSCLRHMSMLSKTFNSGQKKIDDHRSTILAVDGFSL